MECYVIVVLGHPFVLGVSLCVRALGVSVCIRGTTWAGS